MYRKRAEIWLLMLAALTACQGGKTALVKEAQTALNQNNQGRACTTLRKKQLEATIDRDDPEYAKRQVLIKHGVVDVQRGTDSTGALNWEIYTNKPLNEADGNGVFISDGQTTYYCFGRWKATDAEESSKLEVPAGKRLLVATVELENAVPWVKTDPDAKALGVPSEDEAQPLYAINEYDKLVPVTYDKPNQVAVVVDKE